MSPEATNARPERLETVLFDAGGVLLDLDYAFLRRLLEARGCPSTEEALAHAPLAIFDCCPSPPLRWSDLTAQALVLFLA